MDDYWSVSVRKKPYRTISNWILRKMAGTRKSIYVFGLVSMIILFIASWEFLITQIPAYFDEEVGWRFETSEAILLLVIIFMMVISMISLAGIYIFYRREFPIDEGAQLIEYDRRRREKEETKKD